MKLTSEQINKVAELLKIKNVHQVHKITGVSRYLIERIAKGSITKPVTDAEIIEASKSMTYRGMVAKFKCSHSRISNVIANHSEKEFKRYRPADTSGIFSLQTMGEPF